jgi:replication factor C subunit 3/5
MMTQAAQAALRRVIEQYTRNVRFCIICNYVNKITPAIQSRCTRFRFSPLPMVEVEKRIQTVIETEGCVISVRCLPSYSLIYLFSVKLTDDGKEALLKLSRGDMRRALNILQACHAAYPVTDEEAVYNCTGNPHPKDIESVVASMMTEEFGTCYQSMILPCTFVPVDSPSSSVINSLKTDRGLALQDLIAGAYDNIQGLELPAQSRVYLLDQLAVIE